MEDAVDAVLYAASWFNSFSSSNIREFRYVHDAEVLHVRFVNGSEYVYYDVPPLVVAGWVVAPSKGSYHYYFIRDSYSYNRL